MDLDGLSYLHVLNADETEDVTKRLSNILQEAAESNSPDVDTLWKIIMHLWTVIDNVPYRIPIPPLEGIPIESTIVSAEDMKTQKYASFIQTVYKWLVLNRQTNTHGQALSDIGRYKPGLDEETERRYLDKTDTGRFIHSMAHYFLIQGVFERCAQRGKFYGAKYALEEWERKKKEEEERGGTEGTGEREELKSEKEE